jgi:hypothetical protein
MCVCAIFTLATDEYTKKGSQAHHSPYKTEYRERWQKKTVAKCLHGTYSVFLRSQIYIKGKMPRHKYGNKNINNVKRRENKYNVKSWHPVNKRLLIFSNKNV